MGGHRVGSIILDQLTVDPVAPEEGEVWQRVDEGVAKLYTASSAHRIAGFDGIPIFIFRPGGTAAGNVYTDWADLYAELSEYDGRKDLIFDSTFGTPQVPAGTWDMTGVAWRGLDYLAVTVQVLEGAIITGLRVLDDRIQVKCLATTTSPITDLVSGTIFRMSGASSIQSQGAGAVPLIDIGNAGFAFVYFYLEAASLVQAGTAPAINLSVASNYALVYGGKAANLQTNSFGGVVGSVLYTWRVSTSATLSLIHASFLGTAVTINYCLAANLQFTPGASGLVSTDAQAAIVEMKGITDALDTRVEALENTASVVAATTGGQSITAVSAVVQLPSVMEQSDASLLEWDTTNHELLVKADGFLSLTGGITIEASAVTQNTLVGAYVEKWSGVAWNQWGASGGFAPILDATLINLASVDVRAAAQVLNGDKFRVVAWMETGSATLAVYGRVTGIQAVLVGA